MRITRIYQSTVISLNEELELSKEASHHLATVLRMKVHDSIIIFDGSGFEYSSEIIAINKNKVTVLTKQRHQGQTESDRHIHLVQSVSRGEKMDFVMQKATELGVSVITPIISEYCGVNLSEKRWQKRQQHWQAVVTAACEQSGRVRVPAVNMPQVFNSFVSHVAEKTKLIFTPGSQQSLKNIDVHGDVCLMIGPEGGFSDKEILQAEQNDFIIGYLGPRILRTETAAIAALSILQNKWGDL